MDVDPDICSISGFVLGLYFDFGVYFDVDFGHDLSVGVDVYVEFGLGS